MKTAIRSLIERELTLALPAGEIAPSADLYALGLTPYGAVCLLLAVEREFHVELPREMLRRETARSIEAILEAVQAVRPSTVPAEWRVAA
ncbi:MAG: phosphopantetheine-binding protein [Methylocystis sp.]